MNREQIRNDLYERIIEVSGPHIKIEGNTVRSHHGIDLYGSYHLDGFNFSNALRSTLVRFDEFEAPQDFANRRVIDIGSNLGSLSFECLRRGAEFVTGYEYCEERVQLCREIAEFLGLSDRCDFVQIDLREVFQSPVLQQEFLESNGQNDIVFCCAVDAYVDKEKLYDLVASLTADLCYFETNSKTLQQEFQSHMIGAGFASVRPIGTSKSDKGYGRKSYILDQKQLLKERRVQTDYRGYRFYQTYVRPFVTESVLGRLCAKYDASPDCRYNHRSYRLGDQYIREFESTEHWAKVKSLYHRIEHIPYVLKCDFSKVGRLSSPFLINNLADCQVSEDEKKAIRTQVVELVTMMNEAGVAHRDMHCANIFFDDGQIQLVDLECLEEDRCSLHECYDLTGEGLESPLKSGRMNVFREHPLSISSFVDLQREDFDAAA